MQKIATGEFGRAAIDRVSKSLAENGTTWRIEFLGVYPTKGQDLPLLVVDTAKLTGNRAAGVASGKREWAACCVSIIVKCGPECRAPNARHEGKF